MSTPRREGQIIAGESLAARYASFVKLPHTLFALPFAGLGLVLASFEHADRLRAGIVVWSVFAFTAARFAAMGFNRIVDRDVDALNPRTRARELPSGRLSMSQAAAAVVVSAIVFVGSAWMLNPLCGMLSPVALAWIFFYSWTKRFTSLSHFALGLALGIAPVGGYLALAGEWTDPWWALPLVAAAVMTWVAGFDVIYALQDLDFDREHGLRSIPARLGAPRAVGAARVFHLLSVLLFGALAVLDAFPVGRWYVVGVAVMLALLLYEHAVVAGARDGPIDLPRIDRAFFHANVGVSMALFAFTLIDRVLAG